MGRDAGADETLDVVVVGGGVVGLACAAALARAGRSVVVLERHEAVARETTSRNSEVIHAGIYYPSESWKARLCTRGREALYAFCTAHRVPHRKLGKWIVATEPGEVGHLEDLQARGRANGVPGLEIVDADRVARDEPAVRCVAALHSPETGIVDSHALCLALLGQAEAHGAQWLARSPLRGVDPVSDGYALSVEAPGGGLERVRSAAVVNAAGLDADRVAELAGSDPDAEGCRQRPCKGDYFALAPSAPLRLSSLVYPVPPATGLGIHATLDLAGRIRFGPDAEYVERPRYDVDPAKATRFAEAARRYLPQVRAEDLSPDYAGVRPRLTAPGEAPRDFVIREGSDRGRPGWVDCIGIESPGLTAALAIAERVAGLLGA